MLLSPKKSYWVKEKAVIQPFFSIAFIIYISDFAMLCKNKI